MDAPAIRNALLATVEAIAPETDLQRLAPDRPLREQAELDSLDWVNLLAALQQRLQVELPDFDPGPRATLDGIVAALAARLTPPPGLAARAAGEPEGPAAAGNGSASVTLRPLCADDAPLESDFVRRLSDESRYKRFMGTLRELTPAKLAYLTDVDQDRHVALGATVPRAGQERLVGVARYVVDASGRGCEFAVTVADDWRGSGLAGRLMHALMTQARARGLARMEGLILATNRPMLKLARQLGFQLAPLPDDARTLRAQRAL